MQQGRPIPKLILTTEERKTLQGWARRRKTAQPLALRARIVLACAESTSNTDVSCSPCVCASKRWASGEAVLSPSVSMDCWTTPARSTPPNQRPGGGTRDHADLGNDPTNATHWSTRLMARRCGMSQSAVSRIWRAFALQPQRSKTFKLSRDPLFVEKVRDIVGLYLNPPERALVLCVNEKAQIQALDRTQPLLPMRPGQIERRTHDYERHGTTSLFAALEMASGKVIGECHRRHRAREFRRFLDTVDAATPAKLDVHLILDNTVPTKRR